MAPRANAKRDGLAFSTTLIASVSGLYHLLPRTLESGQAYPALALAGLSALLFWRYQPKALRPPSEVGRLPLRILAVIGAVCAALGFWAPASFAAPLAVQIIVKRRYGVLHPAALLVLAAPALLCLR